MRVLSFTAKGFALAEKIAGAFDAEAVRVYGFADEMKSAFEQNHVLVFVGAAGIAVRAAAPYVKDKTADPAVIVVDEAGRFVIPILSGHIGGANHYAGMIAEQIKALPIITTATDVNGLFAVDVFAAEKGYAIRNPENIKYISAALLDGREVGLYSDFEIYGGTPPGLIRKDSGPAGVCISDDADKTPFEKTLVLAPRRFHIGVGARKNTDSAAFENFLRKILKEQGLFLQVIASISSADIKKDEEAITRFAEKHRIPFITYSTAELSAYDGVFTPSEFVRTVAGVGNVCETSAWLSSRKGEIIMPKTTGSGVAAAIARQTWRVSFASADDRAGL